MIKPSTDGRSFVYAVKKHVSAPDSPGRFDMIATNAYYKAEERGFEPGHELDDWLKAETEMSPQGDKT
jgi:hypothetical protein